MKIYDSFAYAIGPLSRTEHIVSVMTVECPDCGWEREAEDHETEFDLHLLECPNCKNEREL